MQVLAFTPGKPEIVGQGYNGRSSGRLTTFGEKSRFHSLT